MRVPLLTFVVLWVGSSLAAQRPSLLIQSNSFSDVTAITAKNGRLYVVDRLAKAILMFDAQTGRSLGTLGRAGKGPMEFELPDRAGWIGDTLWVRDLNNRRFQLIHDGRDAGTTGLGAGVVPPHPQLPPVAWGAALMIDGSLLAYQLAPNDFLGRGILEQLSYYRVTKLPQEVFTVDVSTQVAAIPLPLGGGLYPDQPFSESEIVVPSGDGRAAYIVDRGRYTVTRLGIDGSVEWKKRIDVPRRPLGDEPREYAASKCRLAVVARPFGLPLQAGGREGVLRCPPQARPCTGRS